MKQGNYIYISYATETTIHEDGRETQSTDLVKAFSSKECAIKWAKELFNQTKKAGYKFYWNERESLTSYSAELTEYYNNTPNNSSVVSKEQEHTTRITVYVCCVNIDDNASDPSNDVCVAMYC